MTDATARFFEDLARRGHEPLLGRTNGSLRFDLTDGSRAEHWFVRIADGDIEVSRSDAKADCEIRANQEVFESILSGEMNAMVAYLRGLVVGEDDVSLLIRFQRLFPPPKGQPSTSSTRSVSRQRS
jgi:putative sterol carrier protein